MQCWRKARIGFAAAIFSTFPPLYAASEPSTQGLPSQNISARKPAAESPIAEIKVAQSMGIGQQAELDVAKNSKQEKDVDWVTRSLAICGALLGGVNFVLTIWKIRRDRRLSVEDDFWFRKIIAPVSIEPLIKTVMTLLHEMPDVGSLPATMQPYAVKITTEFQKLYASMQTLALVDESWPTLIIERLRACEDLLTNRVAELISETPVNIGNPIDLQSAVLRELNAALHKIKDGHLKR